MRVPCADSRQRPDISGCIFSVTHLRAIFLWKSIVVVMSSRLGGLLICVAMLLVPMDVPATESRPRSILVIDQSDLRGTFYREVFAALRDEVGADLRSHVTLYAEGLDLERFKGEAYQENLRQWLRAKYANRPIGAVVAVGPATLELALRWRSELWPGAPIVFALVGESDLQRLKPPPDVTGDLVDLKFADSVRAARAVVPDLKSVAIVGDAWDHQIAFRTWQAELETAAGGAGGIDVIDLMGLTMSEVRQRVADLPAQSAIVYTSMHSDGEGAYYTSATALSLVAEKANRPIIVSGETLLAPGGIGGFVLGPAVIGKETARVALRILAGESPSAIPRKLTEALKPVFNWKQMQRWGVSELDLPPASEIRFRDPTFWEKYRWQTAAIAAIILIQAALISVLLQERKRRSDAEEEARSRLTELAHVGRQATAGELSSSIAHELNQPLGAILANAETAELMLDSPSPDLVELREILADIRRDDQRASDVIHRMRSFLKRTPFELKDIDLNVVMREAFDFLGAQASARNVELYLKPFSEALPVTGDAVQLQQVILNLVVNSMEAMSEVSYGRTVIGRVEPSGGSMAAVSISDSGPGIAPEKLADVFDPFFTTKREGMGIGLSIARTIVQAHKGTIWAENHPEGGAVFHLSLPLTGAIGG